MVKTVSGRIKYDLTDLEGIGSAKKQKLNSIGYFNVDDFGGDSRLQKRKIENNFSGRLKSRLLNLEKRGLRDRHLSDAAIEKREQIRERKRRQRSQNEDPTEVGFSSAQRDEEEFQQAFETFTSEFERGRDVPVAELGRSSDADKIDGSIQPLINASTDRRIFQGASQPGDFENALEESTEKIARKRRRDPASPGELRDAFVGFVDEQFGLGPQKIKAGAFEVRKDEFMQAKDIHADRSAMEQRVDDRRRATVTTNFDQWRDSPGRFDFPGVDTPRAVPEKKESDLPFMGDSDGDTMDLI